MFEVGISCWVEFSVHAVKHRTIEGSASAYSELVRLRCSVAAVRGTDGCYFASLSSFAVV